MRSTRFSHLSELSLTIRTAYKMLILRPDTVQVGDQFRR